MNDPFAAGRIRQDREPRSAAPHPTRDKERPKQGIRTKQKIRAPHHRTGSV